MAIQAPRRRRAQAPGEIPRIALVVVLALVAVNAVYGGIGLMVNGMGMPSAWLDRMPTHSWTVGGIALLVTVAVPQAWAGWAVAVRRPQAPRLATAVGATLMVWIVVELAVLQRYFFLQPVIAVFGLVEIALALWWSVLSRGPAPRRPGGTAASR